MADEVKEKEEVTEDETKEETSSDEQTESLESAGEVTTSPTVEGEENILNHKLSVQLSENTRLRMEKKQLKQELFNLYLKHYD